MRLRLLTALAIAGLAIASCSSAEQNTTAETPPADAVDVAADFIKARDAWDSAKTTSLLAPDAVLDDFTDTVEDYPDTLAFFRATEWRFTLGQCRQTNTGQPAEVSCTYTYENAWTNALGVGPYSGSSFEFVIADGLIQDVANNFDSSGFSDDVWDVFNSWIRLNHNPDLLVMYPDSCCTPSHTPEAVVLWKRYTNEFAAEQGAEALATTTTEPTVTEDSSQPFTSDEALAVMDAYFAAFETSDVDAARGLFASDALITGGVDGLLEDWEVFGAWDRAQRAEITVEECVADRNDRTLHIDVRCEYTDHQYLARAVGAPSVRWTMISRFDEDGKIDYFFESFEQPDYNTVNRPFNSWMQANHPDDADKVNCCQGNTIEESIERGELRVAYADLWVAYLEANDCTYLDGC